MSSAQESAALVALLQLGRRRHQEYAEAVERSGGALNVLHDELSGSGGQASLLPADPAPLLSRAAADIEGWRREGFHLLTVLDDTYPENLRTVHDRPPVLFVSGSLKPQDARSIAVIGARRASTGGLEVAASIATALGRGGFTVISGLATGIDTAAH